MFYNSDNLSELPSTTPIGPLLETIFYGVRYGIVDDLSQSNNNSIAPQMFIECAQEQQMAVLDTFSSSAKKFVEEENAKIKEEYKDLLENDDFEEEIDFHRDPLFKTTTSDRGISFYFPWCGCSTSDECEIDPFTDSLKAAVKTVKDKYPDVQISIALIYHVDVGYHYGYEALWLEGDDRKSTALLLNFALRQNDFWSEDDWEECSFDGGYEGLLSIILDLYDCFDSDIIDIFISHIPDGDSDRRNALLARIKDFQRQK